MKLGVKLELKLEEGVCADVKLVGTIKLKKAIFEENFPRIKSEVQVSLKKKFRTDVDQSWMICHFASSYLTYVR